MNTRIMLRCSLTTTALTAVLALTACGGEGTDSARPSTPPAATASATAATFNAADVEFATNMIPHHRQATVMADHAATRAGSAQVKQLAEQIKAAQDPEIQKMSGWLTAWGKPVPSAGPTAGHGSQHAGMPGMMSEADMTKMMAAKGAAFDRMFLTMMITHHEGAITMAKDEQAKGSNPDAKQMAGQIIDAQTAEITTMKQMLTSL